MSQLYAGTMLKLKGLPFDHLMMIRIKVVVACKRIKIDTYIESTKKIHTPFMYHKSYYNCHLSIFIKYALMLVSGHLNHALE